MDKEKDEKQQPNALAARVLDPAALVDYQDGAVVSREIVRGGRAPSPSFPSTPARD